MYYFHRNHPKPCSGSNQEHACTKAHNAHLTLLTLTWAQAHQWLTECTRDVYNTEIIIYSEYNVIILNKGR